MGILVCGLNGAGKSTLGRMLVDGEKEVSVLGEKVAVKAEIYNLEGFSGHADRDGLLDWLRGFEKKPRQVFVNHGENTVTDSFARTITEELGFPAMAPYSGAEYDLLLERFDVLPEGIPVSKPTVGGTKAESLYKSLLNAGESLLRIVREAKGKPNKTLQHFTDDLNALIKKYK